MINEVETYTFSQALEYANIYSYDKYTRILLITLFLAYAGIKSVFGIV